VVALVVGAAVGGYRIRLASVEARNRELEQQVLERTRESERRRKELEALYQLAAIKERTRLARDLHDSVKQKTFAALAQIGASRRMIPGQPERAAGYIEEAETLVHDVLQELVTMIQEMYPNNLPERGLADALRDYAVQWTRQSGILVELRTDGEGRLAPELEAALYRVFQEALSNVARHSQADHVTVELRCYEQTLDAAYLKICDNGSGFDPGKVQAGVGLRSMRERVEALGGLLYLTSAPGEGTCLEVILPGTSEVEPDKQLVSNQAVEMT
jgi:NarL family two-component system sensor histidine kinase LiaS